MVARLSPSHEDLHGAIWKLEQLQDGSDGAGVVDLIRRWIVVLRILLGHDENVLVVAHHFFERLDRFLTADEQRHDHAGENDDIAQRENWVNAIPACIAARGIDVRHLVSFPGRAGGREMVRARSSRQLQIVRLG
jgi:hypothetical protein